MPLFRHARVTVAAVLVAAGLAVGGAIAAPAGAATPGPGGIVSDEFNAGVDGSVWHLFDPAGDSTLTTSAGHAVINVPPGRAHDLWPGNTDAPRLLQNVPNGNFDVEVKLDGVFGSRYQMEGLVVQQDAANLVRLEVHYDGSGTNLFAATESNGSAVVRQYMPVSVGTPLYLRLSRSGDSWTFRYSSNGTTWLDGATFTFPLTVTQLGVFAGSSGETPPGFVLPIDYVRDVTPVPDATPPVVSGVTATPTAVGAKVHWTTDEPATSNVAFGRTVRLWLTPTGVHLPDRPPV